MAADGHDKQSNKGGSPDPDSRSPQEKRGGGQQHFTKSTPPKSWHPDPTSKYDNNKK